MSLLLTRGHVGVTCIAASGVNASDVRVSVATLVDVELRMRAKFSGLP